VKLDKQMNAVKRAKLKQQQLLVLTKEQVAKSVSCLRAKIWRQLRNGVNHSTSKDCK